MRELSILINALTDQCVTMFELPYYICTMVYLGMEAEGAERVRGLAVGGSSRRRVHWHPVARPLPRSYKPHSLTFLLLLLNPDSHNHGKLIGCPSYVSSNVFRNLNSLYKTFVYIRYTQFFWYKLWKWEIYLIAYPFYKKNTAFSAINTRYHALKKPLA